MQLALRKPSQQPLVLRPYQQEAIDAVYAHLRTRDDNPCVVLPTAAGKTPVIAAICRDSVLRWNGRVLILAHVKELLEQAAEKLQMVCPDVPVGVYSAGLNRRDRAHPVIIAGIQSVYRRADEVGRFDLVLIDEAHLVPPEGDGMYRQFLAEAKAINPHLRVIGLTATPFRLKSGPICTPEGYLNRICYEIGVRELIVQGYLCPLKSKAGRIKVDTSGLHIRGGEFIASEVEALMDGDALVRAACQEIVEQTADRHSVLIFAAGVKHALHVQQVLESTGQECGFICGETLPFERARSIERFRSGDLKYLVNVNVLTTGFDAPNVDCVALLRPTMSPGLYYQMLGRGFRLHESKRDCLVLDFGGNVLRHGPVDQLRVDDPSQRTAGEAPAKECPQCNALIHAAYATCPECGHTFPAREKPKHEPRASSEHVLSGEITITDYGVQHVCYSIHTKRNAPPDAPKTMRVDYQINFQEHKSEWVCFEHPPDSYARKRAEDWWRLRSNAPIPDTAAEAVELGYAGAIADATKIRVRSVSGEKYDRIVGYEFAAIPPWNDANECNDDANPQYIPADDEIPF